MHKTIHSALVLAAGFGKRLQSVSKDLPKPLVQLGQRTALEVTLESFNALSTIKKIFVNTHWQAEKIERFISTLPYNQHIHILHEKEILETGGGILNAMRLSNSKALIIKNADAIFMHEKIRVLDLLLQNWDSSTMNALLLLVSKNAYAHPGDFAVHSNGSVFRAKDSAQNQYIFTGCSIISAEFFQDIKHNNPFPLSQILFQANQENFHKYRFYAVILPEDVKWFDIGTPQNLELTRSCMQKFSFEALQ